MTAADGRRIIVVTGAATGIGLATATRLAAHGWAVVGVDLHEPERPDPFLHFAQGDLSDAELMGNVLHREVGRAGELAGLVNNAAFSPMRAFLDADPIELDHALTVNVRCTFMWAQTAARVLVKQRRGGVIVGLGSVHGHRGTPGMAMYATTKGAVDALMRVLAVELAPHGIRCNNVDPAPTSTPRLLSGLDDAAIAQRTADIPLGRLVSPDEVADAVAFLFSESAAFITGVSLPVDGGYLARGGGSR